VKTALIKVVMSLGVVFAAGLGIATTASAQTATADCSYGCATVPTLPTISSADGSSPAVTTAPAVAAAPAVATAPLASTPLASTPLAATSSTSLAFTGADVGGTLGVAAVLVGGGIVMVRLGRRKRSA
jgi:hypothetical protein